MMERKPTFCLCRLPCGLGLLGSACRKARARAFVELIAAPAVPALIPGVAAASAAAEAHATPISLRLGENFDLRLPPGFDADSLRQPVEKLQLLATDGSRRKSDAVPAEAAR